MGEKKGEGDATHSLEEEEEGRRKRRSEGQESSKTRRENQPTNHQQGKGSYRQDMKPRGEGGR